MTAREKYVVVKRARSDAFRSAAAMVDPDYRRNGLPVYSSLIGAANAAAEHADWADGLTAKQFNAEQFKP